MRRLTILCLPAVYWLLASSFWPEFVWPATIFLTASTFWFTEIIPLSWTAVLILILALFSGHLSLPQILGIFSSDVILLLLALFIIALALQKQQCEWRLVSYLLNSKLGKGSLQRASLILGLACFLLSMWISNSATCLIFMPICIGLVKSIEEHFVNPVEQRRTLVHLLLLCTYSASIGGIVTPIGSPPNLLALDFLAQYGQQVGFLTWVKFGFPLGIMMLTLAMLLLKFFYPLPKIKVVNFSFQQATDQKIVTLAQWQAILVFIFALVVWVLPELLSTLYPQHTTIKFFLSNFNTSYALLFLAGLLFVLPSSSSGSRRFNLELKDLKKIDWDTLLLFVGGLALGSILTNSGAVTAIVETIAAQQLSLPIIFACTTLIAVVLSEFVSNTASVAVLAPLAYALAQSTGSSVLAFVLALAIAASLGFMLPMSTIPNALVYATGQVKLGEMVKAGLLLDFFGWLIVTTFFGFYFGIFAF